MAWNTEETQRRLIEAATVEFGAHGPDGTTMERIARRAGINKERLYNYFGDKQHLFATVLSEELAKAAAAVPIAVLRDEDAGEYAGRCFDYLAANPNFMRLLHWEALAYGDDKVPDETGRAEHYREKVESFAASQNQRPVGGQPDTAHLFSLIFAVAHWWFAVPQLARMITGSDGHSRAEHKRRRAAVVEAARRMTCQTDKPPTSAPPASPPRARHARAKPPSAPVPASENYPRS